MDHSAPSSDLIDKNYMKKSDFSVNFDPRSVFWPATDEK